MSNFMIGIGLWTLLTASQGQLALVPPTSPHYEKSRNLAEQIQMLLSSATRLGLVSFHDYRPDILPTQGDVTIYPVGPGHLPGDCAACGK